MDEQFELMRRNDVKEEFEMLLTKIPNSFLEEALEMCLKREYEDSSIKLIENKIIIELESRKK